MEKVNYTLVFNRRKRLNKKGTALVQVEAYLNRRKSYFSTKVYLKPEQWDSRRRMVKCHPNADGLNQMLYSYVADIEQQELQLWQQGKPVSLELLKNLVKRKDEPKQKESFFSFYETEVESTSLKDSTKRNHLSTLTLLREFKPELAFDEVTFELVTSFENHLQGKGYHTNTIAKHMKHLKRYVNAAIDNERMDVRKYAFRRYHIRSVEGSHTHLSPEELHKLESLHLEGKHTRLGQLKDAFLFCCYAGLRYSDFVSLTPANIIEFQQKPWLVYTSVKTGVEVRLPLYLLFGGKGVEILQRHKEELDSFFQLKNNSNVNKRLETLRKLADIDKHISFHTARHTNATLLIYNGANITTVQKLLGHRSLKTTQIYTNIMDMTLVRDLEKTASLQSLENDR